MRLENSELRTFRCVVEVNGFNRAAELLHVSQSAVSQAIANLEAKLGIALLQRGKQLVLTDAGRRLLEHAQNVLNEEQDVLSDIARLREGGRQALNVAINSTINRFYAPQLLSRFAQANKSAQLKITELPSRNLIYTVLSGKADLAIGPFQKHMEAFTTLPLFREQRQLVVSPRHPDYAGLCHGSGKNVAKRLKQTVLVTSYLDTPDLRPSTQRLRDRFETVWEVSSLSLRLHLVGEGLGAAFIDSRMLQDDPLCRDFTVIGGQPFSTIERQVGLYYKTGKVLDGCAQQFIQLCQRFWGVDYS
ncbi:MAG TPA: LysR family transcriptional regulator [Pseudomonadales bacterium]